MKLTEINQLLKAEDLASHLGVKKSTLLSWREKYEMPYVKIGDKVLISEPHFLEWIERTALKNAGKQQPTEHP